MCVVGAQDHQPFFRSRRLVVWRVRGLGVVLAITARRPVSSNGGHVESSVRWSRGSDPRLLRLTMDGLLDQRMWGATPCIKDRPHRKIRHTRRERAPLERPTDQINLCQRSGASAVYLVVFWILRCPR